MRRFVCLLLICLFLCGAAPQAGGIPRIYNVTLTNANQEYSQTLTGRVYQVNIQCRTASDVKLALSSGASGTTYFTIKSGMVYYEQIISSSSITVYLQSATAGVVVEILAWSEN